MFASSRSILLLSSLVLFAGLASFAADQTTDSMACGKACISKGQYTKAVDDFRAVVQKSPKSCEGHLLLGQVYCKLKQYKQAKDQLRLAIRYGHGSTNAQQANVALMKLPPEFLAPKTGPDTRMLASRLGLPKTGGGALRPTVIDFYATWCNPCQQLHAVLDKAKTEYGDKLTFMRVDVDDASNAKLLDQYEVSPIPTVVYLNAQGEVVSFSVGFSGEASIKDGIKKILTEG
jgi:thioredoxin 1